MKVKLKLDLQSVKGLVLEHGEKLALAVVAVVFLMFVYSALQREVLDAGKQPDRLLAKAQQVRAHASPAQSAFDPKRDGLAVVEYTERAKRDTVDVAMYAAPRLFDPPLADPKKKRGDPDLLAIKQLQAVSGFGVFALTAESTAEPGARRERGPQAAGGTRNAGFKPTSDASLDGRPYVVVTGLVPHAEQAQENDKAFKDALGADPDRDQPQYVSYVLERAEIDPNQPGKLEWGPVETSDDFESRWEATMEEVVSKDLLEESLVARLAPLVGAKWGEAVSHQGLRAPSAERAAEGDAETPSRNGRQPNVRAAAASKVTKSESNYRLCRAFDFAVEPSKEYRYRLKARLRNPNFHLPIPWVENDKSTADEFVETEWSEPTSTVAVPDGFDVLAGSVTKDSRGSDPQVTMIVTAIVPHEGIEAFTEVTVQRASALEMDVETAKALDPRNGLLRDLDDVKFRTGIVVVDIHGGESLSRKLLSTLTGPVEVLVRDRQGNLRVHNELDDQPLVEVRMPAEEKAVEPKPKTDRIPGGPARPRQGGK